MKSVILFISLFTSTLLIGQQSQNISIDVNGTDRQFILYVPNIYDGSTPAPLLFCFHGYGSSASTNYAYTKFRDIADTAGFVLIHPQGSTDQLPSCFVSLQVLLPIWGLRRSHLENPSAYQVQRPWPLIPEGW